MLKETIKDRVAQLRKIGGGKPVDGVYPLEKFDHDGNRVLEPRRREAQDR